MSGLTKLISSAYLPSGLNLEFDIVENGKSFTKRASALTKSAFDHSSLLPDDDHVGIHLVGLGDVETYGFNRNGDGFPKKANVNHHHTFTKHGHVYEHHRNKDPQKALGKIAASLYNEDMGRVELFIHAHKEKAKEHLEKLASTGEVAFSMACHVRNDRCAECGYIRRAADEPNQCEHIKHMLGKQADDGSFFGVYNDEPKFFDISFVSRPADRIAWNLKTASATDALDSISLAKQAGVIIPECEFSASAESLEKYAMVRKLANYEEKLRSIKHFGVKTAEDQQLYNLAKLASGRTFTDSQIDILRECDPTDVFTKLAANKIVMDPTTFVKYVLGPEYGKVQHVMPLVQEKTASVFTKLANSNALTTVVTDTIYNHSTHTIGNEASVRKLTKIANEVRDTKSMNDTALLDRLVSEVNSFRSLDNGIYTKTAESNGLAIAEVVAQKYATYKLSATYGMSKLCSDFNEKHMVLSVAQNLSN